MTDDAKVTDPVDPTDGMPKKPKRSETFVRHPGKTREDRMPVNERPRVKAAAERYRRLRESQGLSA